MSSKGRVFNPHRGHSSFGFPHWHHSYFAPMQLKTHPACRYQWVLGHQGLRYMAVAFELKNANAFNSITALMKASRTLLFAYIFHIVDKDNNNIMINLRK